MRRFGVGAAASTVVLGVFVWCSIALSGQAPRGVDAAKLAQARDRFLADLQRRLLGPSVQHAGQDQRVERRRSDPGLGLPAQRRPGLRGHQGNAAADQRRDLPDSPRQRLGARRAHRTGAVAPHLAIHRRDPHRQSRRGRPRRVAVLRNARLPSRVPEHQGRLRALAEADLRSRPVLLRVGRAGRREEPRHRGRQRRRPRHPRLRPGTRSRDGRDAVAVVRRAAEEGRSRLGDLAERRGRRSTAAG